MTERLRKVVRCPFELFIARMRSDGSRDAGGPRRLVLYTGDAMVLHFLIRGRVQGVGFRWFVQREASELELRGWVRNTEDGDVEVLAAGSPEDLSELRTSLRRGPRGARVDNVIEHHLEGSEAANLTAFRIEGAW